MIGRAATAGFTIPLRAEAGPAVTVLFGVVTQLGDVWFLFLLGGVVYVGGASLRRLTADRRRGLFLLALAVTYVALIETIKPAFGLPRPPGAGEPPAVTWVPPALEGLLASITTAEGPGFPSGHALGSTMVWGGLALVLERGSLRRRLAVVGVIVALVCASRLVLGVHSLVDVLAGAAIGAVVLVVLYRAADRGAAPGRVLLVAVCVGLLALLVSVSFGAVAAFGGAVGGWLAWRAVADRTPARPTSRVAAIAGLASLAVSGVVFGAVYATRPPHAVAFVGAAFAVGLLVIAPAVGERLARP